jgi:Winged helix-turn-helix DNA-binding
MTDQIASKSLRKCDAIDHKIVQLLIENPCATDEEIAGTMGVTRMTVNRRRNSGGVSRQLESTLALPAETIRRLMSKSLVRLELLLDEPDPRIRAYAASQLLKIAIQLNGAGINAGSSIESRDVVFVAEWGKTHE